MIKFVTAFSISFIFLVTIATATSTVVINGLPSTLAVGDTVFVTASGGVAPYSWSTNQPAHIQIDSMNSAQARIIVLTPYPSITIFANDIVIESGYQTISTHPFKVRLPDLSFTDGDTVVIPVYYTDRSVPFEFFAADIFLPYDTTVFKYIGFEKTGTLTDPMTVFSNQVADTIKFGIAASTPVATAIDAVFIKIKFISKDTVVAPINRQLHFTKFEANEVFTAAFINGSLTVNPIPNYPPVFTAAAANDTIDENTTYNFIFAATDSNSHPVRFFLTLNPAPANEASIDSITGSFSFTPSFTGAGEYLFEVTANDGNGGTTPHQFTIVVKNVNRFPTFTTTNNDTVFINENQFYQFSFSATDPDLEALTFSLSGASAGMTIDSLTGLFEWTPDYSQAGFYVTNIIVSDPIGGTAVDSLMFMVQNTNRDPIFLTVPDTFFVKEGLLFTYDLNATDPDGDTLFYTMSGQPAGMVIDSVTGIVSWTPPFDAEGSFIPLLFTVSDTLGGSDAVNPVFAVIDSNRTPIFSSVPNDTTIFEGQTYYFDLSANDNDSGDLLKYFVQSGQPALFLLDSLTGEILWTPDNNQQGVYPITIVVTDNKPFGTATHSFTITVNNVNLAPVITTAIPDTIYLPEDQLFTMDIDATDGDSDPLKYYVIDPPPGMTIDSLTGVVTWTPNFTQAGTYNPTFKVLDTLGGYDSKYVVMIVLNVNRLPVFTTALPDTTISEGILLSFQYSATDPDNDSLTFYLLSPIPGMTVSPAGLFQWQPNFFQAGIDTLIVMVSDGSSVAIDSAVITILNVNTPPIFLSTMNDTAIARFDTLRFTYAATDADSQQLVFSLVNAPANATISQSGALEWAPPSNATGDYLFVVQVTDSVVIITDTAFVRVYRFGDVSGNGAISSFDAGLILRHQVAAIALSPIQLRVANVSGDSTVSPLDASQILQFVVGLIDTFQGGLGKRTVTQAQLSAFSFAIVPSGNAGEYDLNVTVNKPSNVYGLTMSIGFDTAVVSPKSIKQTTLTDSMLMFSHFPAGSANVSLAGTKPMNTPGDVVRFTFALKQQQISTETVVFTMKKFVLNETDYTDDIRGITLNVQRSNSAPGEFRLGQNYPNPFNPVTTIAYQLATESNVIITVYNLLGQAVKTLVHAPQSAGYYTVAWNGTDGNNKTVSSGVYLYKIIAQANGKNSFVNTKKMLLLK